MKKMKILNLSMHDTAGSAYCLSHAINKNFPEHHAINLRVHDNYMAYPVHLEAENYDAESCRRMVKQSDVLVFHSTVYPFTKGLNITREELAAKKTLVYFHGTELREYADKQVREAYDMLGNPQFIVSTLDLLKHAPEGSVWLPVCRSFDEITRMFGICNQDRKAIKTFTMSRKIVEFVHAPTNVTGKGTKLFYRAIETLRKNLPYVTLRLIVKQTWNRCLQLISKTDVMCDQALQTASTYGLVSVEASIFHKPVLTRLPSKILAFLKDETGLNCPFVNFGSQEEMESQMRMLTTKKKKRERIGRECHRFCKAIHDDKPVAKRFMKIIGE
jgi:hypothetical protein